MLPAFNHFITFNAFSASLALNIFSALYLVNNPPCSSSLCFFIGAHQTLFPIYKHAGAQTVTLDSQLTCRSPTIRTRLLKGMAVSYLCVATRGGVDRAVQWEIEDK